MYAFRDANLFFDDIVKVVLTQEDQWTLQLALKYMDSLGRISHQRSRLLAIARTARAIVDTD